MRPALTSGSLKIKTKVKSVETFIKPILVYDLETAVIRKVDFGKLNAALNKTRRKLLKLYSKKTLHTCRNYRKSTAKEYRSGVTVRRANL